MHCDPPMVQAVVSMAGAVLTGMSENRRVSRVFDSNDGRFLRYEAFQNEGQED